MRKTTVTLNNIDVAYVGTWLPADEEGPLGDSMLVTLDIPQAAVTPVAARQIAAALMTAADRAAGS